ncbi:MAG: HAD-IB family hydrolase [Actinobacteria bacterium]|nr:HAD-IB family hydrolase [Actinomycetota bacterium]
MPGAAFFDLDRTLLSRSSSLALAPAFRTRGLLLRRDQAKAALAQFIFVRFGAGSARVGQTAETGMTILKGLNVELLREIVAEAFDTALKPYVYRDALDLVDGHRARGERSFIVSAALQEIVDALVRELGLDGGIGSTAEVGDGRYTGRLGRRLYGPEKADALGELAVREDIDLAISTAYSDSASDLPFLEAVGRPVVVNPDRSLRRIARDRGWPMLHFRTKAFVGR